MRGLTKLERQSTKKLRGKRRRQHEALLSNVSGQGFKVDTSDARFAALLDGDDRYGIDRTDPSYKETGAMRELLEEQTRRRSRKRRNGKGGEKGAGKKGGDSKATARAGGENVSASAELSSLVMSLKRKRAKA